MCRLRFILIHDLAHIVVDLVALERKILTSSITLAQQKLLHLLENKVRESHARIVVVTSMLYKKISDPGKAISAYCDSPDRANEHCRSTRRDGQLELHC